MIPPKEIESFEFGTPDPTGVGILFLHGWTSSPRELRFLAQKISQPEPEQNWKGALCVGPSLPGHSELSNALNNVTSLDYLQSVTDSLKQLQKRCKEIYLVGLSFGGALALHLSKTQNIHGLILLAPFIQLTDPTWLGISKKSLVHLLPDKIPDINKGEPSIKDPLARQAHYGYQHTSVSALKVFFDTVEVCTSDLADIRCPTLLMHSLYDETSDFHNSVHILSHISSDDRRLVALHKSNHIISLDYDRETVEKECLNWLIQRSKI